ncbi:dienelactone hydrolase family protein [Streptomyces sp. NBC_01497]|uniref:dienelactone hydrolase family protein n=1 Tax=Streptomyces sp. NBC_01497 TaxID=2903885 RepID=UPI002E3397A4|nr:dienelactone hydrolase family protein [Streptomyces sp. NBC_01497]
MDDAVEWTVRSVVPGGVVERGFRLTREAGAVPGVLWLPPAPVASPPAVVLLGHGGSGHKRSARNRALAGWFASRAGLAVLAIDGPYHGDRVPGPLTPRAYQARIAQEGIEAVLDRMADDWQSVLGALAAPGIVSADRLAYVGLSMGTRFGLPLAAALGTRLRCAVLGKFGLRQGPALDGGMAAPERAAADARRITAPVLFHVQRDDEIFPREGQLALFDALGSQDKRLICFDGPHTTTDPRAITRWHRFVSHHLTVDGSRPDDGPPAPNSRASPPPSP